MAPRYLPWQWLWLLPISSMAYAKAISSQTPAQTEPVKAASAVGAALSRTTQAPLVSMESFELLRRARGADTCGYINGTSALVCNPGLFCSTLGRELYWHCCESATTECFVPTACLDSSAYRNGLCGGTGFNTDRTACCSESTLAFCSTIAFRDNAKVAWVGCLASLGEELVIYQDSTTKSTTPSSSTPKTTTASTTTSEIPTPTPTPEPTPIAPIVGGVVGGVAVLAIFCALFYFLGRKKKRDAGSTDNNPDQPTTVAPVLPTPTFPQQPAVVQHYPQYPPQQVYVDPRSSIAKSPHESVYGLAGSSVFTSPPGSPPPAFNSPPGSPPQAFTSPPSSPPPPGYGHSSTSNPGFVPQYGAPPASELPTSRQTDTTTYEIGP